MLYSCHGFLSCTSTYLREPKKARKQKKGKNVSFICNHFVVVAVTLSVVVLKTHKWSGPKSLDV